MSLGSRSDANAEKTKDIVDIFRVQSLCDVCNVKDQRQVVFFVFVQGKYVDLTEN